MNAARAIGPNGIPVLGAQLCVSLLSGGELPCLPFREGLVASCARPLCRAFDRGYREEGIVEVDGAGVRRDGMWSVGNPECCPGVRQVKVLVAVLNGGGRVVCASRREVLPDNGESNMRCVLRTSRSD